MYICMYEKQKDIHQSLKSDCLQESELRVRVRSRSCTLTLYMYTIANIYTALTVCQALF